MIHEGYVTWMGDLESGEGRFTAGSGAFNGTFDHSSRLQKGGFDSTPEELLAAALAASFTMTLADLLGQEGHPVETIETRTEVAVRRPAEGSASLEAVRLVTRADVAGIDLEELRRRVECARRRCILSAAIASGKVRVEAELEA